ncbi:S8 family serine peptidase [Granulibacter bethesdensis]|uniref:S8 family serine peptidase n=1 Tax=Granulibacter bethesdensis TaxID=364410 RepID=UPI0003F1E767|nr:S8 family serine peptidase [Granulibacter bethesdensis]APG31150.1 Peptidase S8 family protein [Granulibacter bethesdensis CGDNIH4]
MILIYIFIDNRKTKFIFLLIYRIKMTISENPNDPLFQYQWGLKNTGQANGGIGVDIDVVPIWPYYTGKGIRVGVIDSGVQLDHPDLKANIDPNATWDAAKDQPGGGPDEADENHGTAVAGIIGAVANNGIGGSGVAPDVTLGSYHITLGPTQSYTPVANQIDIAYQHALDNKMDVLNNSWGSDVPFAGIDESIQNLAETGRKGLGIIYVKANGNERASGNDSILDAVSNSPYVIAVAAVDNNGVASRYSTPGVNLLISAPGGGSSRQQATTPGNAIVSTDRTGTDGYNTQAGTAGDYVYGFNGTSAASPFVSGVAALVLQANPNLNYRDVQQILAKSARITDNSAYSWFATHSGEWNGGGSEYNRNYGFGLVDARAAVRLAESYKGRTITGPAISKFSYYEPDTPVTIPTNTTINNAASFSFTIQDSIELEHIALKLNLSVGNAKSLNIVLVSPNNTNLNLLSDTKALNGVPWGGSDSLHGFTLTSPALWGEQAKGTWTVKIWDDQKSTSPETIDNATLAALGSIQANRDLIFTNDFGTLAAQDSTRQTISSVGTDQVFNASPVSTGVSFNAANNTFSINGTAGTIKQGSSFKTVFSGDGNDTLVGGNSATTFNPGYGNNSVLLGNADNTVNSIGNDTITATQGVATVNAAGNAMVFNNAAQLNFVSSAGASTVIGGNGAMNVNGGASKVTVFGGTGADTIIGGSAGGSQLTANGAGSTVFANGNGNVLLGSKTGAVTLATQGANNTVFGGIGGGTILSKGINDLVVMDQGTTTLFGGQNAAIFTNRANANIVGETGSYAVGFGSGTSNAWASASTDLFLFANGQAGGNVTIGNFQDGKDFIQLQGYGANVVQTVLAGAQQTASGLSLTLSDNTHITLLGVTSLNQYSFMT